MKLTRRRAIDMWTFGFAQAGLILAIAPKRFSRDTAWEASPWQREIAIWNTGTLATIVQLRRAGAGAEVDRALGGGFTVLSALFAANHLAQLRRTPLKFGHWLAAGANLFALGAWFIAGRNERD
jgi:hypothetical protein